MTSHVNQRRRLNIDLMRGLAIIAVVVIHCVAPLVSRTPVGAPTWIVGDIIDSAARWSVPLFVMISGGLLIKDLSYKKPLFFYKKRMNRLLIPLISWPIIYFLWYSSTKNNSVTYIDFIESFARGNPLGGYHLYFLFIIAGLYAVTPILSAFVSIVPRKHVWVASVVILITSSASLHLSQLLGISVNYTVFSLFIPYIGYFLGGYLLTLHRITLPYFISSSCILLSTLTIAGLSYLTFQHTKELPFYDYLSITVIVLTLSVYLLLHRLAEIIEKYTSDLFQKIIYRFSRDSFGVYLIHILVLETIISVLHLQNTNVYTALSLIPVTISTSWTLVWVLAKVPAIKHLLS